MSPAAKPLNIPPIGGRGMWINRSGQAIRGLEPFVSFNMIIGKGQGRALRMHRSGGVKPLVCVRFWHPEWGVTNAGWFDIDEDKSHAGAKHLFVSEKKLRDSSGK